MNLLRELFEEFIEEDCHTCCDNCEAVYVTENNEIITEASVRAYKRYGEKLIKKYRCLAGPKKGKLVSHPGGCAQRKDPKKVRTGRKTMRAKKGIIQRKGQISKRKQASKRVTQMNKRLAGDL